MVRASVLSLSGCGFCLCVRFRSHSCVQLCSPSRQPQLHPEISVTSPCASPYPCSSPRKAQYSSRNMIRDVALHQQQLGNSSSCSPQHSPKKGRRIQQHPHHGCLSVQQSTAADNEVHLLCSSDLRSAILTFLQQHSNANGQDFVLLSSSSWASPCKAAAAAGTAQRRSDVHRGVQCMLDPAADCWHETASDTGDHWSAAAAWPADPAGFTTALHVGVIPGKQR